MALFPMPNLSFLGLRRYDVDDAGMVVEPDGFPHHRDVLMTPLMPVQMFWVHDISPMAKLNEFGEAAEKWNYELPPQEVLRTLVSPYHITGTQAIGDITFGTQALGPVNVQAILSGVRGLVSPNFKIVP